MKAEAHRPERIEALADIGGAQSFDTPFPTIFLDGKPIDISKVQGPLKGKDAFVLRPKPAEFSDLCARLDVTNLVFYNMPIEDLSPLALIPNLRGLKLEWNAKATDLSVLRDMPKLEALGLCDLKKLSDLSPLSALSHLEELEISGGMWSDVTLNTLAPIGGLANLRYLVLKSVKTREDGLRPLAGCAALQGMFLPSTFDTEDYAYLSVKLPSVQCRELAAFVKMEHQIGGKDVLVIGKRKPFLSATKDADRLAKYEAAFRALQDQHR